uniref:Putative reverse transcriptase domain-containing protein n=1 Tax=Tanacetum cinerariifolium TaxID=118510 RepID=A0A699IC59_TANCI|nr:putative reverse transcriptase domain-containing protein [Tanacetum cinerariifolium]
MRELVVKYKAEKVCHEEMVKMPLVDLKVLEDGSFKICMDYRELTKIDLYLGCHQMRVHEDEIPKIAFRMRYGHFELTVMPFRAAEEREVSCEAQQCQSGVKRKFFRSYRNNMGNEPILALPKGSDNFVVMRRARFRIIQEALGVRDEECDLDRSRVSTTYFQSEGLNMRQRRWMELFSDYGCETKNVAWLGPTSGEKGRWWFILLDRIWILMVGNVRTLIMEKAHATKYSVRLGVKTIDKVVLIKEKFKAERDRQKSYADTRRKSLEFEVGDWVMLTVSPWKGVIRFGKKGKFAPRNVGPFEILERINLVAYRLRLPEELSGVHDTFHVSNLKKCLADASLNVPLDEIKVDKTLRFVEEPLEIIDREVKRLKRSRISLMKVRWNFKCRPEFTWERKDYMKSKYPQLFVKRVDESAR